MRSHSKVYSLPWWYLNSKFSRSPFSVAVPVQTWPKKAGRMAGADRLSPAFGEPVAKGLVRIEQSAGRKVVHLTEEGRAYVKKHRDQLGTPWETATENFGEESVELRGLVGQVAMATMQMAQAGSNTQLGRTATRRPFSRRNRSARAPRSLRGGVAARPWWSRRAAPLLRGLR